MRHGAVSYFADEGRPARPDDVVLNEEGRGAGGGGASAARARSLRPRAHERAAPADRDGGDRGPEPRGSHRVVARAPRAPAVTGSRRSPPSSSRRSSCTRSAGVVPNDRRFLGGETIGELFDRVLPALERLLADDPLGHGARRPPRRREPGDPVVRAHGRADVPRALRAGARLRERPRRRRRVDRPRGQRRAARPPARVVPPDDDGGLLGGARSPSGTCSRTSRGRAGPAST